MVKLVVLYGTPEDADAFEAYYTGTHVPLVEKIPGLRRFEYGSVLGTPDGSPPPYFFFAELAFDDRAALDAGLGSLDGQAATGDVPNFASGGVTLMIAEA